MGMKKRIGKLLKDRRGSSFPLSIAITLALVILFCGVSEYLRLYLIAEGVRDAVEDAIVSVVNDNYYGVYHGVREGYSGNYLPNGGGSWEAMVNEGGRQACKVCRRRGKCAGICH